MDEREARFAARLRNSLGTADLIESYRDHDKGE
jgi:hypothetical protein